MNRDYKFRCEYKDCVKSFKAKKSLIEHMRIHNGERPYGCNFPGCVRRFTQYSSLQKHERTHTGDKPYRCEICSRAFTQDSNLKRHEKVHFVEKTFVCEVCGKRLTTPLNLKIHLKTHKNEELLSKFACKVCKKIFFHRSQLHKHLKGHEEDLMKRLNELNDIKTRTRDFLHYQVTAHCTKPIKDSSLSMKQKKGEEHDLFLGRFEQEPSKFVMVDPTLALKPSYSVNQDSQNIEILLGQQLPNLHCRDTMVDSATTLVLNIQNSLTTSEFSDSAVVLSGSNISKGIIRYKGQTYHLHNQLLKSINLDGEANYKSIESDTLNPSRCHPLPEVSHFPNYASLRRAYQEIANTYSEFLTLEMLLSERNCNSFTCKCGPGRTGCDKCHCTTELPGNSEASLNTCSEKLTCSLLHNHHHQVTSPTPDDSMLEEKEECNKIKLQVSQNQEGHICLCHITRKFKHNHGPNCGHEAVRHDDHLDYIVDGVLHHPDGDHCDDHGPICFVETTSEDFALSYDTSKSMNQGIHESIASNKGFR